MLVDEILCQDILHVAGVEQCILDLIQRGVYFGIFDRFGHIFDTDHFLCLAGDEVGDRAGSGVQVINHLVSGQSGKFAGNFIEFVSLFTVGLVERFRPYFELKSFHILDDMVFSAEHKDVLVGNRIVAFFVDDIHQRSDLRELFSHIGEKRFAAFHIFIEKYQHYHQIAR